MIALLFASAWVAVGLACYDYARRSWMARWGTDDAPACYLFAALMGPATLGFVIAEIQINRKHRK